MLCAAPKFTKVFHAIFISVNRGDDVVDIENSDVMCSPTFVVGDFSGLFLRPSI